VREQLKRAPTLGLLFLGADARPNRSRAERVAKAVEGRRGERQWAETRRRGRQWGHAGPDQGTAGNALPRLT